MGPNGSNTFWSSDSITRRDVDALSLSRIVSQCYLFPRHRPPPSLFCRAVVTLDFMGAMKNATPKLELSSLLSSRVFRCATVALKTNSVRFCGMYIALSDGKTVEENIECPMCCCWASSFSAFCSTLF